MIGSLGSTTAFASQLFLLDGQRAGRRIAARTGSAAAELEAAAKPTGANDPALARLKARDEAVRAHEASHVAAGGSYVRGAARFSFQQGSDGKAYAIGGEVSIDTSPVAGDPQATIAKMEVVRAAALAPADPSGQDLAVAGAATQAIAQAQAELAGGKTDEGAPSAQAVARKYSPASEGIGARIDVAA